MRPLRKNPGIFLATVLVALAAAAAGGLAPASAQTPDSETWRYTWTPPTYGAAPAYYIVEIRVDGTDVHREQTPDARTEHTFEAFYGRDYEVRVIGVDGLDREGVPSAWSIRKTCELGIPQR